jgi:hypothetical protein
MAFNAHLTNEEEDRLHQAIREYLSTPIVERNPNDPPPVPVLGPTINTAAHDNAIDFLDNTRGIVESQGTLSIASIWRTDRHFYIKHGDQIFHISTDEHLSQIYEVKSGF